MKFYQNFINKEKISGMIFDVDGTLLDSMPVWDHSGEHYLASIGIHAPASLGKILFSMTMQQGAEYIKQTYGLDQSEEEIKAGIIQIVADDYRQNVPLKPSALEFLEALYTAGIPMTVATSTDKPLILAAFHRLELEQYFIDIFSGSEFGSGKDRPEIFYAAAACMNSVPASTWVVEDGLYAIRTAKAAGFRIIGAADASSKNDEPEIRRLADYFITDFAMDMI